MRASLDKRSMKLLFLIALIMINSFVLGNSQNLFKGQRKSLVNFQSLNVKDWMDFRKWKEEFYIRNRSKYWDALARSKEQKEEVGRVLACYGECQMQRGVGINSVQFRSKIYEGDEVRTLSRSYMWIYLFDGTILRLAPHSSLTTNEINVSNERMFFNLRFNQGNILMVSRRAEKIKVEKERETDPIFYPLKMHMANPSTKRGDITLDEYLFGENSDISRQYKRLNDLVLDNNKYIKKTSSYFISMPNASIFGDNFSLEAYVAIAGDHYFKKRVEDYTERTGHTAKYNLRGYSNLKEVEMADNQWYKVSLPAKRAEEIEAITPLRINELLTKRIPTILVARELMIQRYSKEILDTNLTDRDLAEKFGYRLWRDLENDARMSFLVEFNRKLETSNLAVAKRFRQQVLEKSAIKDAKALRHDYYETAMNRYLQLGEINREKYYIPKNNSETKAMWKYFNGVR